MSLPNRDSESESSSTLPSEEVQKPSPRCGLLAGFPKSLLTLANDGRKLVEMLRKCGLNTASIKAVLAQHKIKKTLDKSIRNREDLIIDILSSPRLRAKLFVDRVARTIRNPNWYGLSLEYAIFSIFESDWESLALDEDVLTAACCGEWAAIRQSASKWAFRDVEISMFGVFMLWPRVLLKLQNWDSLDATEQESTGYLTFALSSIAEDDWFVRKALEIAPVLKPEIAHLLRTKTTLQNGEDKSEEVPIAIKLPSTVETMINVSETWATLGNSLAHIYGEWQECPRRDILERLTDLAKVASVLLAQLPKDEESIEVRMHAGVEILHKRLLEVVCNKAMIWLEANAISQVIARWNIAQIHAQDEEAILDLIEDAAQALERLDVGVAEMQAADDRVREAKQVADQIESQLSQIQSGIHQLKLTNEHLQAKEDCIAAERKRADVMLFVLASASPWGDAFDPAVDYLASIEREATQESDHGIGTLEVDTAEHFSASQNTTEADSVPLITKTKIEDEITHFMPDIASELAEENATDDAGNTTAPRYFTKDEHYAFDGKSASHSQSSPAAELGPKVSASDQYAPKMALSPNFTEAAGDHCRPIWLLLRLGRPTLAYQLACALEASVSGLLVPPPALLKSVALAPGLVASDGPLAISIGEAFAEIDAGWFEPGVAPANWHTALNLLLLAATLRPMIFAPGTGGSAIARYRHLDGRYTSLLELTRRVEEISEPLTGFKIGPSVLRSAADETSLREQLSKIAREATDWLYERAPNKKNQYAPASKVWLHWLKPGELIHGLMLPLANESLAARNAVSTAVDALSDYGAFRARVEDTDRHQLQRRGPDIIAGALDHLWMATCEAVAIAKEWLATASMLSDSGGRLRVLVGQLQATFDTYSDGARKELEQQLTDDTWDQVGAASQVLLAELNAIADMFKEGDEIPIFERQARELLVRDLLWVPNVTIREGWGVESSCSTLIQALTNWSQAPVDSAGAFAARLKMGDIAGAKLLLPHISGSGVSNAQAQEIERTKEQWQKDLQRSIQQARRASEVGLAYGYLADDERVVCDGLLSAFESELLESDRFDMAMKSVAEILNTIERHKEQRVQEARSDFEREKPNLSEDDAKQVELPLMRSDIHTFNELMQRVRDGVAPWPERASRRDVFQEFYPNLQADILSQISNMETLDVDKMIRAGGSIGCLSFELGGDDLARSLAEQAYQAWAMSASRRSMGRENLRKVLEAVGVPVRSLDQERANARGHQCWVLHTTPIEEREICPVPHFGSRAQGRYRVLCVTERMTPEDILQGLGDDTQQIATIIVLLGRNQPRFWSDIARISKEHQRSCLLLDESILLFLLTQRGQRLSTWFGVALPFTYSEPYDASAGSVTTEMFYGRAEELARVKAQGDCYFIYGGRQLGKTALLRRAEKTFHDSAADHYAIWIDLLAQGIGERRPASDVWAALYDKLLELKIAGLEMPSIKPARQGSGDTLLASIKTFLSAKPGRRILLLLDEADRFFEQDGRQGNGYAETRRLKQLMDETDRRFKVVFAGLHNVLRTASTFNQPLGHLNEAIRIGPLMNEHEIRAAEDLITRPIEAAGFEFEDRSLVMRVLAQTNYYPSLIQLYCTQLLRHLREEKLRRHKLDVPRFKIEEADIESVFSGRPLRNAIRSKFRLTLRLDDRYEIIANTIGLEALSQGFDHVLGVDWRRIRKDCSTWWPEGFANTSEREFLSLLEEMVHLGVLRQGKALNQFSLRNPNVLLLLGSKQEIENTLQAEREPRVEFESTIFRPALQGHLEDPARNPLTYRQLDEVMQLRNSVILVAASDAAGATHLVSAFRDQAGMADTRRFVVLERATDKRTFVQELDKEVKKRLNEGITLMMVQAHLAWDEDWVASARDKLRALKSVTSFVSVVFVADPQRLWSLSTDVSNTPLVEPWLSVLPWSRAFVRKWLEELQLTTDAVDRLAELTGYWGELLESMARVKGGTLDFSNNIEHTAKLLHDPQWCREHLNKLTGSIGEAEQVLMALCRLGDGVTEADIVEFGEQSQTAVERALRWAEPLGLVMRQKRSFWALEPFTKCVLKGLDQ